LILAKPIAEAPTTCRIGIEKRGWDRGHCGGYSPYSSDTGPQKIESDDLAYGISPYHIHPNDTRFTKVLSIVFEEKQEERRTHMPTSENSVVYLFKK